MDPKQKGILKYTVSAAIAIGLLYISFRDVEWKDFWENLRVCRRGFVGLAMAFGVISFFFRAARWRMLLLPIDESTGQITTFNAVNIGYVANMVLPRIGEIVRCGFIMKNSAEDNEGNKKASFEKVLGTVVVDRVWDVMTLLVFVFVMLWIMRKRYEDFVSREMLHPMVHSGDAIPWLMIIAVVLMAVAFFVAFKCRERGGIPGRAWKIVRGVGEGIKNCLHIKHGWMFIVYTIAIWCIYWLMCASIIWALQGMDTSGMSPDMAEIYLRINDLNMIDALFLTIVGALSTVVPVPGGFGAFHYLVSLALSTVYGIPASVGIIFATLSHESQIIIEIICGGFSYIYETVRK